MSQKWRRSQAWDDQNIPSGLWPIKALLRAFSSIWLAVILLTLVAFYGVLASVPIGLVALAPTYAVYALTVVLSVAGPAVLAAWAVSRMRLPRGARFVLALAALVLAGGGGWWLWQSVLWPALAYDPATGRGLRFFAEFSERYRAITLRRLPCMEMSEPEFYAWWPLSLVLVCFVLNMIVATARRIEFTFKNLGVLSVHTGIVLISVGSLYYSSLKLEGDVLLTSGEPNPTTGAPGAGREVQAFYDNKYTVISAVVGDARFGDQRLIRGLPRYNDYNLAVIEGSSAVDRTGRNAPWNDPDANARPLSIELPAGATSNVDPSIKLRVVGYASYADASEDLLLNDAPAGEGNPVRLVKLSGAGVEKPVQIILRPGRPDRRIVEDAEAGIEYTLGPALGMSEARWRDLTQPLPPGTDHALLVETAVGAAPFRAVYPVKPGDRVSVGSTGFTIEVKALLDKPPFPIITPGYQNATSSLAQIRITGPSGSYDRWVYHRFAEIAQDFLDEKNSQTGMPKRRPANPEIRVTYLDCSRPASLFLDEPRPGRTRAAIRSKGGALRVIDDLDTTQGKVEGFIEGLTLEVSGRFADGVEIKRPAPVPERDRARDGIGTHDHAMVAVEVTQPSVDPKWRRVTWLSFAKYAGMGDPYEHVALPDGRDLKLAFSRYQHKLPGLAVQLLDFQMLSYDHRGSPRDYQSVLRVRSTDGSFETYEHAASLNYPLSAPFMWREDRNVLANFFGNLAAGLSPNQFKFSQAGWDAGGWQETRARADAGELPRPYARFTILQVGNSPGIHVIALGAALMALGIPWAFYVKPWLVRREKARIQRQLADGTYRAPARSHSAAQSAAPAVEVGP